jgi:hypothetical protein
MMSMHTDDDNNPSTFRFHRYRAELASRQQQMVDSGQQLEQGAFGVVQWSSSTDQTDHSNQDDDFVSTVSSSSCTVENYANKKIIIEQDGEVKVLPLSSGSAMEANTNPCVIPSQPPAPQRILSGCTLLIRNLQNCHVLL